MSGALLVGLCLVVNAVEPPSTAAAPAPETTPRQNLIEVGGGVAATTQSLRIGAGFEQPLFANRGFFVGFTLRADWRHYSVRDSYSLDTIDALAGLRLGASLGNVFELFFGLGVGAACTWQRDVQIFHGWRQSDRFGVAWQGSGGARVHLGERVSLFIVPVEVTGEVWPSGYTKGNPVSVDFTPSVGLGVRL